MLELISIAIQAAGAVAQPLPTITASETFDRAPAAVSATYTFQCDQNAATLVIQVPQVTTQSGAKVSGPPNVIAFLNGAPVDERRIAALTEAIRAVAVLPEVTPGCSRGIPYVSFHSSYWRDRSATWRFIEIPSGE